MKPSHKSASKPHGEILPDAVKPGSTPLPGESRKIAALSIAVSGDGEGISDLSPETMSRFTDLIMNEISSCVSVCGGEFHKVDPQRILALYGTGREAEQTCRRAVDSAFRILKTLSMINMSIARETGDLKFNARIGIAWGKASITSGSDSRTMVTGRCVNQSVAIMKTAMADTILVSDGAKANCEDFFSWEPYPCPSMERIWIPVAEKESVSVHPLLRGIPFLAREREMEHLQAAWSSCRKWFNHAPVLILGKPGIGKTRLIEHFLKQVDDGETKIVKLGNRLWDQPPLGMWLPLMEKGTFDPYGTVMANIRELRRDSSVILAVEDLHWADEASLKLLGQLARTICDIGVFLVLTSRSEPEGQLESIVEKLTLQALDRNAVQSMLESIAGRAEGSEADRFTDFLMERAAGNPLLVIELILHSLDTGTLARDSTGYWYMVSEPDQIIPQSAESFLQARMSTLRPDERLALQVASVLGNGFPADAFSRVFQDLGCESGSIVLARLENMGFLRSENMKDYCFTNSILSGTVYRTIIRENRILIHRAAAEVLADHPSGTSIAMARHWIEAGAGREALPWLFDALKTCIELGDLIRADTLSRELHKRIPDDEKSEEALELEYCDMRMNVSMGKFQTAHEEALRLTEKLSGRKLAHSRFLLGQAMENLGLPLREVVECYREAAAEAERAGDVNVRVQALSCAGAVLMALGKKNSALDSFNSALEFRDVLDSPTLARLHGNMGILLQRTGSNEEALKHYSTTLELGRKCGNMGIEANALSYMGQVQINMGQRETGLENYRKALAIHRKAGNRRGECTTLGNLAGQMARFGDTVSAIEMLERAIAIAEEIGHTRSIMTFNSNIGLVHKMNGDYVKAEEHIRKAMQMMERSGDKRAIAAAHLNLCTVLSNQSRLKEAIEEARRALRFACTVNSLTTQSRALGNLGWLMLKTDRSELSRSFFREAYKRSSLADDHSMLADSKAGEGLANLELGCMEEAAACCDEAFRLKEEFGIDFEALEGLERLKAAVATTGTDEQGS